LPEGAGPAPGDREHGWRVAAPADDGAGRRTGGRHRARGGEQLPLFTALKLYPFTRPDDAFEPFISAGVGLALGIDDRTTTSSDLLGLGAGSGTAMLTGFGFRGGAGVEWRFSQAFGLSASGRYQWIRFGGELGGERTFKGPAFEAGLTYRFQYRGGRAGRRAGKIPGADAVRVE